MPINIKKILCENARLYNIAVWHSIIDRRQNFIASLQIYRIKSLYNYITRHKCFQGVCFFKCPARRLLNSCCSTLHQRRYENDHGVNITSYSKFHNVWLTRREDWWCQLHINMPSSIAHWSQHLNIWGNDIRIVARGSRWKTHIELEKIGKISLRSNFKICIFSNLFLCTQWSHHDSLVKTYYSYLAVYL